MQRLYPLQNDQLGSKIENAKLTCKILFYQNIRGSVHKSTRKRTKYPRNEMILIIGHLAKNRAFAKWSEIKNAKNMRQTNLKKNIRVFLCTKALQKTPNIREMRRFEKRPSCRGSSICKMVSLTQKFQKHAKKNIIRELFCSVRKTSRKNTNYSRNETILKNGQVSKAIAHAKAISFAK